MRVFRWLIRRRITSAARMHLWIFTLRCTWIGYVRVPIIEGVRGWRLLLKDPTQWAQYVRDITWGLRYNARMGWLWLKGED